MRLARAHVASMAGNALVIVALAGSILLVDPEESRSRVAMTLGLTMVPFALLAPLVGPWLDRLRGGRRWVIVGANAVRAVVALLLVREIAVLDKANAGVSESIFPYVLAFILLIGDKSYNLAKSALVPSTVHSDEELVQANALLTRLSGIAGLVGAVPGVIAIWIGDNVDAFGPGQAVMALATIVFVVATVAGAKIPKTRVAEERTTTQERRELRGGGILLAASAMGLMRGILGFITFLLAFWLQELQHEGDEAEAVEEAVAEGYPTWQIALVVGAILGASVIGPLLGTLVAPALRQADVAEERILQMALVLVIAMGLVCLYVATVADAPMVAAPLLVLSVGTAVSTAKLSFDTIVQRDAPDANRGRAFARFETRFQLVWVIGAFIPVLLADLMLPDRLWIGYLAVTGCAGFALLSYLVAVKAVAAGQETPQRKLARDLSQKLRDHTGGRRKPKPAHPAPPSPPPASSAPAGPAPQQPEGQGLPPQPPGGQGGGPPETQPAQGFDPRLPPKPPPPPPGPPGQVDDTAIVIDPTKLH